jgi:hypothetical protein
MGFLKPLAVTVGCIGAAAGIVVGGAAASDLSQGPSGKPVISANLQSRKPYGPRTTESIIQVRLHNASNTVAIHNPQFQTVSRGGFAEVLGLLPQGLQSPPCWVVKKPASWNFPFQPSGRRVQCDAVPPGGDVIFREAIETGVGTSEVRVVEHDAYINVLDGPQSAANVHLPLLG